MLSSLQQQVDALKRLASAPVPSATASSAQNQTNPSRKAHQGVVTKNNPNMCFAARHAPAQAVENNMSQTDTYMSSNMCSPGPGHEVQHHGRLRGYHHPTKTKELWAINGTPKANAGEMTAGTNLTAVTTSGECKAIPATIRLDATDTTERVMALCRILDDAACDLHFYRSFSGNPHASSIWAILTTSSNSIHTVSVWLWLTIFLIIISYYKCFQVIVVIDENFCVLRGLAITTEKKHVYAVTGSWIAESVPGFGG